MHDTTRPPRILPLGAEIVGRAVQLALLGPPGETTYWTAPAMAKASGVRVGPVQRIWRGQGLQPQRTWLFKLSNDPRFAGKVGDIVGRDGDPPAHVVVLSTDNKSQIQALDRTLPGLLHVDLRQAFS